MTKLYLCLFWQKNPERQEEYDGMKTYMSKPSAIALGLCALVVPMLGLLPDFFMTGIGEWARPFFEAHEPHHMPVPYFSEENLVGAAKSIVIGFVLYFVQRMLVMKKGAYPERWPRWLDLEELAYRPLLRGLIAVGGAFAWVCDKLMDFAIPAMNGLGGFFARVLNGLGDGLAMAARVIALHPLHRKVNVPVGNRFTYSLGRALDTLVDTFNRVFHRAKSSIHFESLLSATQQEATAQFKRFTRSISFGLLMVCIGLLATLIFLLI
jgi:hydrogenase-4 component B